MKYFLLILVILGLYLNRSYAYFYNSFDKSSLTAYNWVSPDSNSTKPKFITLGDSLMAGVGASSIEESLSFRLYKMRNPEDEMQLINLAVPGAKIKDVLNSQLPAALTQNPENIVILVGVNDVHDLTPLPDFEQDYHELLHQLSKTNAKITLINIPYLGSDKILFFPWNFYMDYKTKQYNGLIKKVAMENNLKVVDLYTLSKLEFSKSSDLYSVDQFHPSGQGYQVWSELITHAN